jgi:hypothetical protein
MLGGALASVDDDGVPVDPRICRSGVPTQTPASHRGVFSWYTPGQIKIQSPGLAALTADCTVVYSFLALGQALVLPLQTSSTREPLRAGSLAEAWLAAKAVALVAASARATERCKYLRIGLSPIAPPVRRIRREINSRIVR